MEELNPMESKRDQYGPPEIPNSQTIPQTNAAKPATKKMADHVTDWAGVERLEGFNIGEVFSEALKKHSRDEVEEYFTVGTPSTTPPIESVDTGWPKPWMFLRTFAGAAFIYFIFVQVWHEYYNWKLVPGLIMVGSFAVPVSALIFFIEMNARRNVSLYQVIRLLFLGGIISITTSLILFDLSDRVDELAWCIPCGSC